MSEDVMRRLPIGMLVGVAKARYPERRRISKRLAKVSGSGARADRPLQRVNDPARIVTEQHSGERGVVRPAMPPAASSEQFRQLADCFVTQRNKINGLAPSGRFLGATRRHHLADDSRKHSRRVLPADQVKALERLVDEVERVAGIGVRPLGRRCEQGISQLSRRDVGRNSRQ